jgi:hypothetical protein
MFPHYFAKKDADLLTHIQLTFNLKTSKKLRVFTDLTTGHYFQPFILVKRHSISALCFTFAT